MVNLANKVTILRIILVPLFVVFFFIDTLWSKIVALFIVILIEITDYLDGRIARKQNKVTTFGKLLDPFADSLSRLTIFICFATYPVAEKVLVSKAWGINSGHLIPVWMVVILLARDISNSMLRSFGAANNKIISARKSGKIKAGFQSTGIFIIILLLIINYIYPIPLTTISYFTMLIITIITTLSGIDYIVGNKEVLKKLEK